MSKAGASKYIEMQVFSRPKAIATDFSAVADKGSPTVSPVRDQKTPPGPPSPLQLQMMLGVALFPGDPEQKIEQDLKGALAAPESEKTQRLIAVLEGIIVNKQFPLLVKLYYKNPQKREFVDAAVKLGYKADNDQDKDQSDKLFGFWVKVLEQQPLDAKKTHDGQKYKAFPQAIVLKRHRVDECFYDNKNARPPVERHPFDMLLGHYCFIENYHLQYVFSQMNATRYQLQQEEPQWQNVEKYLMSVQRILTGDDLIFASNLLQGVREGLKTVFSSETTRQWVGQLTAFCIKQANKCRLAFAPGAAIGDFNCIESLNLYDMHLLLEMRSITLKQLNLQVIDGILNSMFPPVEAKAHADQFKAKNTALKEQFIQLFEILRDRSIQRVAPLLDQYWGLGYLLLSEVHHQTSRFYKGQVFIEEEGQRLVREDNIPLIKLMFDTREQAFKAFLVARALLGEDHCSNLIANAYSSAGIKSCSCFRSNHPDLDKLLEHHSSVLRSSDRVACIMKAAEGEAEKYLAFNNPSYNLVFTSFS